MRLRERGIYSLPNGRELIVLERHENGRQNIYTGWLGTIRNY